MKRMEVTITVELNEDDADWIEVNDINSSKLENACDIIHEALSLLSEIDMKKSVDEALGRNGLQLNSLKITIDS